MLGQVVQAGLANGLRNPKAAAGAEFAQTQFCMDAGIVRRYAARLAEHKATRGCFLLVGIAPLRAAKSARWMKENLFGTIIPDAFIDRLEKAGDPAAEGQRIAIGRASCRERV